MVNLIIDLRNLRRLDSIIANMVLVRIDKTNPSPFNELVEMRNHLEMSIDEALLKEMD